ncbi:MAG TPA: beta-ketoacyl-ACP synthase II [Chloroflexia bacterium]|nr:beta-ketoacyl-ACP synthase II [Chloroflexia bacterium]
MSQERPDFNHLSKTELNEIKNKLARLGLKIADAENHVPGEGGPSLESQLDDLLADIISKASGHSEVQPEPLLAGTEQDKPRRVVVTGMGTINPLAHNVEDFWNGLKKGQSGIARMTLCDPSNYPTHIAGEVKDWDPKKFMDPKDARRMSRGSQFAVAAARQAVQDAGLKVEGDLADEYGVVWGTGNAAYPETEQGVRTMLEKGGMKLSPFFIPTILPNMPGAQIALQLGLKGYNSTLITACASSTQSVGEAAEIIRRGDAEVILTGGGEAPISELGLAGFSVMRAMSSARNEAPTTASRPFDKQRDGFVPSEGASALVLESLEHALARGAHIYAEVIGYGATCDAYHLVAPEPSGLGAVRAMRRALHSARMNPRDIDYINAHGTSTDLNDKMETVAVKKVFGDYAYQVPMSSTKSMIGHLLGGAGGVEAVATILMMKNEMIHPTINYEYPDEELDLDYVPNRARPYKIKVAMSNSFGFGGHNASIIFKQYKPETQE